MAGASNARAIARDMPMPFEQCVRLLSEAKHWLLLWCWEQHNWWGGFDKLFFFFSLFSLFSPRVLRLPFQKLNVLCHFVSILIIILLIVICFAFNDFWSRFCFSILSLNIWFHLIFISNLIIIFLLQICFWISSLIILFYLIFMSNLVLILLISIFFLKNSFLDWFFFQFHPSLFGWLRILLLNIFVFAFYGVIFVSWPRSRVLKISSIWLWFFLGYFFKFIFFQFYPSTLGYWVLSFLIFSAFLFMDLSQSHVLSHGLIELPELTRVFLMLF